MGWAFQTIVLHVDFYDAEAGHPAPTGNVEGLHEAVQ